MVAAGEGGKERDEEGERWKGTYRLHFDRGGSLAGHRLWRCGLLGDDLRSVHFEGVERVDSLHRGLSIGSVFSSELTCGG